jgi:hypothetical protein
MHKPLETPAETYHRRNDAITMALTRCAVGFASKHRDDESSAALLHQVLRLANLWRTDGNARNAANLDEMLSWYEAGGLVDHTKVVLSKEVAQESKNSDGL